MDEPLPLRGPTDPGALRLANEWLDGVSARTDVVLATMIDCREVRSGRRWRAVDLRGDDGHRYVLLYPMG